MKGMIKILVSNKIYIEGLNRAQINKIKETLRIKNPLWFKLQAMGNTTALWATPKYFKYYEDKDGELIIPRGMRIKLLNWLSKQKEKYEIKEDLKFKKI